MGTTNNHLSIINIEDPALDGIRRLFDGANRQLQPPPYVAHKFIGRLFSRRRHGDAIHRPSSLIPACRGVANAKPGHCERGEAERGNLNFIIQNSLFNIRYSFCPLPSVLCLLPSAFRPLHQIYWGRSLCPPYTGFLPLFSHLAGFMAKKFF